MTDDQLRDFLTGDLAVATTEKLVEGNFFRLSEKKRSVRTRMVARPGLFWIVFAIVLLTSTFVVRADYSCVRAQVTNRSDGATIIFTSDTCLESTITVDAALVNAHCSIPLPATIDLGFTSSPMIVVTQAVQGTAWHYQYSYHALPGRRLSIDGSAATTRPAGGSPPTTQPARFDYCLPYPADEHHLIGQGAFGPFSHNRGGCNEQCIDFVMPLGTIFCAARAGRVIAIRQDSNRGGGLPAYADEANYIIVEHDDGTCAEYQHLERNGALVRLGQLIAQGQPIGRSGNTGWCRGPHLHFGVFNNLTGSTRITYPLTFRTTAGDHQTLVEGRIY
jgi:hypothetical protein